jgi:hypothetical protein
MSRFKWTLIRTYYYARIGEFLLSHTTTEPWWWVVEMSDDDDTLRTVVSGSAINKAATRDAAEAALGDFLRGQLEIYNAGS